MLDIFDKVVNSHCYYLATEADVNWSVAVFNVKGVFSCAEGRIDFATFVSILDKHSRLEKCQQDIVDAFKAHDLSGQGVVPASELRYILTQFGDKMSTAEGMLTSLSSLANSTMFALLYVAYKNPQQTL